MPIVLPPPPSRAKDAVDAFRADESAYQPDSGAEWSEPVSCWTADRGSVPLRYPHVLIDINDPEAYMDLQPYAWQCIYGTLDDPISFEVDDRTQGNSESVSCVHGEPLWQTVGSVARILGEYGSEILREYGSGERPYLLNVLHLRPMSFRAIVLDGGPRRTSLAIPIGNIPDRLAHRQVWTLEELVAELREMAMRTPVLAPRGSESRRATTKIIDTYREDKAMNRDANDVPIFNPLKYISYDIPGQLDPIHIGPLPNAGGVIQSSTIFINAQLPNLGTPGKLSPEGPGGPGGGQYIEILTDDEPSSGRITAMVPYAVHFTQLQEGTHMLHFMLSAGDGECVKDPGFATSRVVHVKTATSPSMSDKGPIIIYNLPRAAHRVDDVILDFALVNLTIDDPDDQGRRRIHDYQVRVYISEIVDGSAIPAASETLEYYNSYKITNLGAGKYSFRLVLVDRSTNQEVPISEPYARTKERMVKIVDRSTSIQDMDREMQGRESVPTEYEWYGSNSGGL